MAEVIQETDHFRNGWRPHEGRDLVKAKENPPLISSWRQNRGCIVMVRRVSTDFQNQERADGLFAIVSHMSLVARKMPMTVDTSFFWPKKMDLVGSRKPYQMYTCKQQFDCRMSSG